MKSFPYLVVLLVILAPFLTAQHEFTGDGDNNSWSNNENWKKGAQDPALDFPENGANASIPQISGFLSAELSKDITLGLFSLSPNQQFSLNLDSNTLDVEQLIEFGAISIFRDGTLNVETMNVGDLRIVDVIFNIDGGNINGSGFQLWNSTQATLTGLLTIGGSGFASGDATAKFINAGGEVLKESDTEIVSVGVPYEQTGGMLTSESGSLSFSSSATFTGGSIRTIDGEGSIDFQGATNIGSVPLSATAGSTIQFNSTLVADTMQTSGSEEGATILIDTGSDTFKVSSYRGTEDVPILIQSGIQDENESQINQGELIWGGGTLDDFFNNGVLRVESTGGSAPRSLVGLLSNTGTLEFTSAITFQPISVLQNESGGTFNAGGGTLNPASGGLEQTGFANIGTLKTINIGSTTIIATRFINQGEIIIDDATLLITGPGQFSGEVKLNPKNAAALLSVGTDNNVAHTITDLTFTSGTPAGEDGTAGAAFNRGQYTLNGQISSTSAVATDRASVSINVGTWKLDTGSSFNFSEGLPLQLGQENFGPLFELESTFTNSGHLHITRATFTGTEAFTNIGTITNRRLNVGSDNASGKLTNQSQMTLSGGASPHIEIASDSTFTNDGENATLTLVDNASVRREIETTNAIFINNGHLLGALPNRGKSINVEFQQKSSTAIIEMPQGVGSLSFNRKTEIDEGTIKTGSNIFFSSEVEWGKSATPNIEFTDDAEITFSSFNTSFKLFNGLFGTGDGIFQLNNGTLAPGSAGGSQDIKFSEDAELLVQGGTLGESSSTLRNFGTIRQTNGRLNGTLINGGDYTLRDAGLFEDSIFTNIITFTWFGGDISGTLDNTNTFSEEGPRPAMSITGTGKLLANAIFNNNGTVTQSGRINMESNAAINLQSGLYDFIGGSILKSDGQSTTDTTVTVDQAATLRASQSSSASITPNTFTLNGGTLETNSFQASITVLATDMLDLKGGHIKVFNDSSITLSGPVAGNQLDSLTIGKSGRFTLQDQNQIKQTILAANISNSGSIEGDVIQSEGYDSFDPDNDDLFNPTPSVIEGDLTQTPGDNLKTVVRADNENASTLTVEGTANISGDLVIVTDEGYEGSVIPVLDADVIFGRWSHTPIIVSPTPGLTGTISYPTDGTAIVTIERDPQAEPEAANYQHFVYTYFGPDDRQDPLIWGPTADPDGDGVSNLRSFVQGDDPTDGTPPPPLIAAFDLIEECGECDEIGYIPDCQLNIRDDLSGVTINLIDLGDLNDSTDNTILPSKRWIDPNNPETHEFYHLRSIDTIDTLNGSGSFYEVEFSLQDGETII